MKKYLTLLLAVTTFLTFTGSAHAQVTSAPPDLAASPILITGYESQPGDIVFVQLYNNSSETMRLKNWSVDWITTFGGNEQQTTVSLDGWLLPHDYMILSQAGAIDGADVTFSPSGGATGTVTKLQITPPVDQYKPYATTGNVFSPAGRYAMEKTSAGNYTTSRPFIAVGAGDPLYGGGLYQPPPSAPLKIVEILANPRHCSPAEAEADVACYDYIKLFNPTSKTVDLSLYRLRVGWGNETTGINNSFNLSGELGPHQYISVTTRNDGEPYDITASGGYVWFEDAEGIVTYGQSELKYPDLGGSAYRGFSWAYNSGTNNWAWAVPNAFGANDFSRTPTVTTADAGLKPCGPGRERNPETNRCRSTAVAASTLVPCKPGQARNPATNRCRSTSSAGASLKPCQPGQERNPATNRCRKVAGASTGLPAVHDIQSAPEGNRYRWWIAGAAVAAVVLYALYEWRHDLRALLGKFKLGRNK